MKPAFTVAVVMVVAGCAAQSPTAAPSAVETVAYPCGTETLRGVLHWPAGNGPFPALVVVHGDFGPTDVIQSHARRLAEHGYLTLVIDLYRGEVAGDVLDAHIMDRGLSEGRVLADLRAAVDYLVHRPDVRGEAVGLVGWDSGGGYALDAAIKDNRVKAVVTCYGRLTTDPALLAPLQASVLGIFAGKDEGISADTLAQFRKAMEKANKRVAGIHVYPECGHGFLNREKPQAQSDADQQASTDAWMRIEEFLLAELR
jgi:carboxymethylenebutenolidase